jgi:hypothetical protein
MSKYVRQAGPFAIWIVYGDKRTKNTVRKLHLAGIPSLADAILQLELLDRIDQDGKPEILGFEVIDHGTIDFL